MMPLQATIAAQDRAPGPQWMLPRAALERFIPEVIDLAHVPAPASLRKRYGIRVGHYGLLLQAEVSSEVIVPNGISTLPGSAAWLLGLISVRGNLVPIFDLDLLLSARPYEKRKGDMALVLGSGANAVGWMINEYPLPLSQLTHLAQRPALPSVLEGHIADCYLANDCIWLEFNYDTFFEHTTSANLA